MIYFRHTIVSCFVLLMGMRSLAQEDSLSLSMSWVKANNIPLTTIEPGKQNKDLLPLKGIADKATIIALGEPNHGIHEFLTIRNRLFQFLVEEMGVTALAAETGYSESIAVNDYILGRSELNNSIISSVFSWAMPDYYTENRALLDWIRGYNNKASSIRKIHFYGIDITGGRGGQFIETAPAFDSILSYVEKVDPTLVNDFKKRLIPYLSRYASGKYDSLSLSEKNTLTAVINDIVSLFERRRVTWIRQSSAENYAREYREAIVVRELDANFRGAPIESNPQAQREIAMAQNLQWALDQEGSGGRIFLYEANWHISKGPMFSDRWGSSLGEYLKSMFGDRFFSVASLFGQAESENAKESPFSSPDASGVAAMISRTGLTQCILNLRNLPSSGRVRDWFTAQRPIQAGRTIDNMVVAKAFDAILFIKTVHSAEILH